MSTMPTQKEIDDHKHAVVALVEKLTDTAADTHHQVLIDACVLMAVIAAQQYPCCTRKTANAFVLASGSLHSHMQEYPLRYVTASPTKH